MRLQSFMAVVIAAGTVAAPATAQQPLFLTTPGTALVGAPVYALPYAVQRSQLQAPRIATLTVVSVGVPANSPTCQVQIEWRDFDGRLAGVSGPVAIAPEQTLEFSTVTREEEAAALQPFAVNVLSNLGRDQFEGHAKIRSSCPFGNRLRVAANLVSVDVETRRPTLTPLQVTRPAGNVGD